MELRFEVGRDGLRRQMTKAGVYRDHRSRSSCTLFSTPYQASSDIRLICLRKFHINAKDQLFPKIWPHAGQKVFRGQNMICDKPDPIPKQASKNSQSTVTTFYCSYTVQQQGYNDGGSQCKVHMGKTPSISNGMSLSPITSTKGHPSLLSVFLQMKSSHAPASQNA